MIEGADPFELDDVAGGHEVLKALPAEAHGRLLARFLHGEAPLCAAAELVRRGDPRCLPTLVGAAGFLDADDLPVLAECSAGTDALAAVLLAPWLALPARNAAADSLARAPLTAAGYAALVEITEGNRKPPWSKASSAMAVVKSKISVAIGVKLGDLRGDIRVLQDKDRPWGRQEVLRAIATGATHPVVVALAGDPEMLAGLTPPIADEARETLLPYLLVLARAGNEAVRTKAFSFFHRRWRDGAARALSCIARTPAKARDASLAPAAVRALGTMGALDELTIVLGATPGPVRAAALTELERAGTKLRAEVAPDLLDAACSRAARDPDSAVRERVKKLLGPGD